MKQSYLFLADGFEEIEALTTVDVMRRAGMPVVTVSITSSAMVTGAHQVAVKADALIANVDLGHAEWLICPGGMPGASNLAACEPLNQALKAQAQAGGKVAAICASPAVVLGPLARGHRRQHHHRQRPVGSQPVCPGHRGSLGGRGCGTTRGRGHASLRGPLRVLLLARSPRNTALPCHEEPAATGKRLLVVAAALLPEARGEKRITVRDVSLHKSHPAAPSAATGRAAVCEIVGKLVISQARGGTLPLNHKEKQ